MQASSGLFTPLSKYSFRILFALTFLVVCGYIFWLQSRYPNLNDKALMGGAIELQDPLSFEAKYQLDPTWGLAKTIIYTTVNWIFTNRRGMFFGVLFGSAFLTLLRYLPTRGFKNGFANAALGLVIGAPLGVCVNCASPVAAGMYAGGTRAETTLAAMIASPTFNVIVLSMLFALMPFSVAVTKVALTLVLILVLIPIICRYLPVGQLQVEQGEVGACIINPNAFGDGKQEGIFNAVYGFLRDYLRDLWFIVRMTVPLMIAAGFLGSAIATLVPFEIFAEMPVNILTLALAAVIGVIAPVPMAFDVILAASLLNAGVPISIVMTLLFTLGSFSIYSFIVVGRTISQRAAILVAGTIAIVGVLGGYGIEIYKNWQLDQALKDVTGALENFSLIGSAHAETAWQIVPATVTGSAAKLSEQPFNKRSAQAQKLFTREEAWHRGVDRPNNFSMQSMAKPFNSAAGTTSAADMNGDGVPDLLLASQDSKQGVFLFINDGAGHFKEIPLHPKRIVGKSLFAALPVDLNNDGYPDIVYSTIGGLYVYESNEGIFSEENSYEVINRPDAHLALTIGFGDLNNDGLLDMAVGNHTGLRLGYSPTAADTNRIIFNVDGRIDGSNFREFDEIPSETLSIVMSDFNQDGKLDFAEAGDFNQPDQFYLGDSTGALKKITRQGAIIPVSTHTTMSFKTPDLNNDGRPEFLMTQIAGVADNLSARLLTRDWASSCFDIERPEDRAHCQMNIDIRSWYRIGGFSLDLANIPNCKTLPSNYFEECRAMIIRDIAIQRRDESICDRIAAEYPRPIYECHLWFATKKEVLPLPYDNEVPQIKGRNVLLSLNEKGLFLDVSKNSGVEIGGWSWDVKVDAFDNTELQDIFIMNGFWGLQNVSPSKIYLANKGNLKFENQTINKGVEDYGIIPSAAAADYDGDGDIDLISNTINGPLIDFWNNSQAPNSILVQLSDMQGNRQGIGSKIKIYYGEKAEKVQVRELQLSGGFSTLDFPAAHFGLGDFTKIAKIEVDWSTGGKTVLEGDFATGNKYLIERPANTIN